MNAIVQKRLERERKKYPGEEELSAFRAWKESQQTEKDRWDNLTKERDTANLSLAAAQAELEQLRREKALIAKGVPHEDVDYYAFKIGKLVTDELPFEKAAEQFLQQRQQKEPEGGMTVDLTAPLNGGSPATMSLNERINQKVRGR